MKKNLFVLTIGLIALTAFFTNPNQNRHKEEIKNKVTSIIQKSKNEPSNKSDGGLEQAGQALGMMIGGAIIDGIIDNIISTDNYILFSTTKLNWDGNTRIIGFGAFGNVFISNKLDEAVKEVLLKKSKL